ncbi:hypothetical protein Q604_UNBC11962G0001, partial [human gut metagenome]
QSLGGGASGVPQQRPSTGHCLQASGPPATTDHGVRVCDPHMPDVPGGTVRASMDMSGRHDACPDSGPDLE